MAGSYSYTVILDACVLYPAPLRDLLLSLAEADVFRGRWTSTIHDEWTRNVLANRPDLKPDTLNRTVALMNEAVDDCLVENYEYLIDSLSLPDKDDRHVLAAAIVGHGDAIVTFNLKDFPSEIANAHGLEILHPDDFLVAQYGLAPVKMLKIVKTLRERLKNPQRTAQELIATYLSQGLPQTCKLLEDAVGLI
ncbi:PIN domain-containing protein [Collimonas sp. OK412]|jgi:predicted nucleic acid-binding protein|uniref:PIN domain-containing protein n=1 Tax=Collimonas sp. (strain OK412) TaxID=1801619 RepID=UPI0008EBB1CF|nr:PIN domain-containing protein [Collimonas sp. OK412]SFC27030.1 PIN domain-containing protein [Collimonas sp. OK412]